MIKTDYTVLAEKNRASNVPLVSIGVFLYNEARFVRESLVSLQNQDYPNIEIIISDNCSTDGTSKICREIAGTDNRITYHRFDQNKGAAVNSIVVLDRAKGDYFMWASGHDLWCTTLVSQCVTALEGHPQAAIAFGTSSWMDSEGKPCTKESGWCDTRGMDSLARFFTVLWGNMHPVLGLIRTRYLKEIPKIHACAGADLLVLSELAIKGEFIHVQTASWSRRQFRQEETHNQKLQRYKSTDFYLIDNKLDRFFPLLRLPLELTRIVIRGNFSVLEKSAVLLALFPSFLVRYLSGKKQ